MERNTDALVTKEERLSTKCQPCNGDLVNAVDTLRSDRQCTFVRKRKATLLQKIGALFGCCRAIT